MSEELLSVQAAAQRLGIKATTLYDWLGRSDRGLLVLQGQQVAVDYWQTGPRGQGRICIPSDEVDRLREAMRVRPRSVSLRQARTRPSIFPEITVPLGRPTAS